jgi:hypothetical protein
MASLQVYNPVAQAAGKNRVRAAARVADLRGKTVGLYDNCKPGGVAAQQRLEHAMAARFEGVKFLRFSGNIGGRSTLNAKGAQSIAEACEAVIGIRGD